jgi:hypothetical protein
MLDVLDIQWETFALELRLKIFNDYNLARKQLLRDTVKHHKVFYVVGKPVSVNSCQNLSHPDSKSTLSEEISKLFPKLHRLIPSITREKHRGYIFKYPERKKSYCLKQRKKHVCVEWQLSTVETSNILSSPLAIMGLPISKRKKHAMTLMGALFLKEFLFHTSKLTLIRCFL